MLHSAGRGYARAYASARPFAPFADEAALAAALGAVLFRYTQQENISVDQYTAGAHATVHCRITADKPIGALAGQFARARRKGTGEPTSNIAVAFLDSDDEPTPDDSHDVHFLVHADSRMLGVAYNACLFEPATIDRLRDAVIRVVEAAVETPGMQIADLPVLSPADLETMTVDWDSGHAEYSQEPVHKVFERIAAARPDAPAARFEAETLTYAELEARSNQLAHYLITRGVTPGSAVAVCVRPSLEVVVSFLAIWKAGGVYVPLDPTHPPAFIGIMLEEVAPAVVLTQSPLRSLTRPEQQPFCFDTDAHLLASQPTTAPALEVGLEDQAYVLYTSGTTGKPKGVDARHGNLAHYVHVAQQKYRFGPSDVFCSLARYTFSISLFELVIPLTCGACVRLLSRKDVLTPSRLAETLREVTVVHAGPGLLGNLFRHLRSSGPGRNTFPNIRHASSGGDLVPPTLVEEMKQVFENAELFVIYGCTEISCMGCTYPIDREQKVTHTFVGKPFPDVVARVVDPLGNPVPFGAVGEICFAGKGVVRGYLQRGELTRERFVERGRHRFYRTGDMGRLHPDGNVEILGRRDYQVQLRGIRVELPGIENTVREIGLAEQCAMVVKKLSEQDVRLVAFVVKPQEATLAAFRYALSQHLPDYMLPQALVAIEALPVTANGKLDRNALQELPWESLGVEGSREAPGTILERRIAEAFAKTLGVPRVGLDDNFFDRGGHSLLAVVLFQELENTLGLNLPLDLIFEHPTVRGLAVQAGRSTSRIPHPIPLNETRDKPVLYLVLGVQLYRPLAAHLAEHYSVYGVYARRELKMLETPECMTTVPELARDYVEIIRQHQPEGPYRIGGVSFGGIVAYEVAQQLRASGAEVAFVGLIDAVLPECGVRHRLRQVGRLLTLPPLELLRVVATSLRRRLAARFGAAPKSEFLRPDAGELAPIDDLRQAAYAHAAHRYVSDVRPFPGNVELVVAGQRLAENPLQSPDCGWRKHAPSVNVQVLDSDHLGLMAEPAVQLLADRFVSGLREPNPDTAAPRAIGAGDLP